VLVIDVNSHVLIVDDVNKDWCTVAYNWQPSPKPHPHHTDTTLYEKSCGVGVVWPHHKLQWPAHHTHTTTFFIKCGVGVVLIAAITCDDIEALDSIVLKLVEIWQSSNKKKCSFLDTVYIQCGAKKTGPYPISLQIFWKLHDQIARKLVNFCNIIMLNTVINLLYKNFIALWRHLAKTQLLCDAQIYLYSVNKWQLCFG